MALPVRTGNKSCTSGQNAAILNSLTILFKYDQVLKKLFKVSLRNAKAWWILVECDGVHIHDEKQACTSNRACALNRMNTMRTQSHQISCASSSNLNSTRTDYWKPWLWIFFQYLCQKHKGKKPNKLWNQEKPSVAVTVKISFFSQNSERKYYTQIATSRLSKLHWVPLTTSSVTTSTQLQQIFFSQKRKLTSVFKKFNYNEYHLQRVSQHALRQPHTPSPSKQLQLWTVRILLECMLVMN